jgi:8-amino-7-oxononanoate synthase
VSWADWASAELASLRNADRLRGLVAFDGSSTSARVAGRHVISFATNDYLGLSDHSEVRAAARDAIERFGTGVASSRLITGTRSLHLELESALASWKQCDKALVFPTGFAANLGVLATLGTADCTIFSDALNHASIIDGCRLARSRVQVYRHADCEQLAALLREHSGRKIVVTEAVFSMDGDVAPLQRIAELCVVHRALLVVDEAHAVFESSLRPMPGLEVLRVGTLSKTLGSLGGWVGGPAALIDLLVNRARAFIYTTGLSCADAAAALAAIRLVRGPVGDQLRARLRRNIDLLRSHHPSPIIPVVLGSDRAALGASESLLSAGIYVPAIRPPTVPVGTARLRITLSAAHSDDMIARLQETLDRATTPTRWLRVHDAS